MHVIDGECTMVYSKNILVFRILNFHVEKLCSTTDSKLETIRFEKDRNETLGQFNLVFPFYYTYDEGTT